MNTGAPTDRERLVELTRKARDGQVQAAIDLVAALTPKPTDRERKRRKRIEGREYLSHLRAGPCADCGQTTDDMHFHHLDPATKRTSVGSMNAYGRKAIDAEIAKCVLLCADCHRERHRG